MATFSEISDPARLATAPRVSVVVITYNHADCLAQAVDSIAAQKASFPFEIIVAEDCSTDSTRAVAEALQAKYPELVRLVFTPANKGMNRNLRFALGHARAPYIAFCEGDDFWTDERKLERQVGMLEDQPDVDLAISRGVLAYADGRREETSLWDYGPTQRVVPARELFSGFAWVAPSASMLWRSEISRDLPQWLDEAAFADLPLLIAASARGGAVYDPKPTVAYRIAHASSFTAMLRDSPSQARADHANRAIEVLNRSCRDFAMPKAYLRHRINDFRLQIVREHAQSGRWLAALREALGLDPAFVVKGAARRLRKRRTAPQSAISNSE